MPIVIDGWNFIRDRHSPINDSGNDYLKPARTLVRYLQDFQATHNDPIVLVFDSKHEYLEMDYKNSPKLTIVPARDADDYIKRYIDNVPERQRRNVRVVSSDNDVFYYAKSSYATPLKCAEFWGKLCPSQDETEEMEDKCIA
jgi:predicted RNA-binding protein with PIN domain